MRKQHPTNKTQCYNKISKDVRTFIIDILCIICFVEDIFIYAGVEKKVLKTNVKIIIF